MKQPSIADVFSKAKAKPSSTTSAPSFNSSDSEAEAKVVAKKAKPISKRKQVDSDDSDSDSGDLMSRLKAKAVGSKASVCRAPLRDDDVCEDADSFSLSFQKPKKCFMDETFNVSDQEAPVQVPQRNKPSRSRKPITYQLDSDSDSDF